MQNKRVRILSAVFLLVFSSYLLYMCGVKSMFSDVVQVKNEWTIGKFKVSQVVQQGWAGSPNGKFELRKKFIIPFFFTKKETVANLQNDSVRLILFPKNKISFNRCDKTIFEE